MKKVKKDLEAILKALNGLAQRVQKLQEQIGEDAKPTKKPKAKALKKAPKKRVVVRKTAPPTAADKIFTIIKRSKKGINTEDLMKKTGFERKAISNVIYKLTKQGKIKSVAKAIYVKA